MVSFQYNPGNNYRTVYFQKVIVFVNDLVRSVNIIVYTSNIPRFIGDKMTNWPVFRLFSRNFNNYYVQFGNLVQSFCSVPN